MRIIAGKYKRTPLKTLEGEDITRPTRDMVREALFSSIMIDADTTFLDLFSGTGAIGLEALSRGASEVIFNDANRQAVKIIEQNLQKVHESRLILNFDYSECLRRLDGKSFDYIYVDPPYKFTDYEKVFELIDQYNLLSQKGIMIVEVRKDTDLKDTYFNLVKYKEKRYGINKLLYYRRGNL